MNCRSIVPSDIPVLRNMYEMSGLAYEFPDLHAMEEVLVVTDEQDRPIAAAAAERILQLYLWANDSIHPAARLRAVKALHEGMATRLREKGYNQVNCFLPPEMEKSFGRRLMQMFGWTPNWPSFARYF